MPHVWPKGTDFGLWELDVLDRGCPACGRMMHICDHRYRHFDPEALRRHYQGAAALILSIDGLQPEKGHEALYVVRELTGKRVWFAAALLSATAAEVRRLITRAKDWAAALGKPVALWVSD